MALLGLVRQSCGQVSLPVPGPPLTALLQLQTRYSPSTTPKGEPKGVRSRRCLFYQELSVLRLPTDTISVPTGSRVGL